MCNQTLILCLFELKDIISILIGCLFGGIASLAISHWYYLKTKPLEQLSEYQNMLLESIFSGLRTTLIHNNLREFFDPHGPRDLLTTGVNTDAPDTPQLIYAILEHHEIPRGTSARLLLRVIDHGLNFINPQGAIIIDHHGSHLPITNMGFGCMMTTLHAREDDKIGAHEISIQLQDRPETGKTPNKISYSLSFDISKEGAP